VDWLNKTRRGECDWGGWTVPYRDASVELSNPPRVHAGIEGGKQLKLVCTHIERRLRRELPRLFHDLAYWPAFFKRRMWNDVTFDLRSPPLASLLPHAGLDKFPSLRADNLLINRLLQAVEACLRHTELHLIDALLTLSALCRRAAGISLARRNRRRRLGIGLNHGCGWGRRGRLGKGRKREAN